MGAGLHREWGGGILVQMHRRLRRSQAATLRVHVSSALLWSMTPSPVCVDVLSLT